MNKKLILSYLIGCMLVILCAFIDSIYLKALLIGIAIYLPSYVRSKKGSVILK